MQSKFIKNNSLDLYSEKRNEPQLQFQLKSTLHPANTVPSKAFQVIERRYSEDSDGLESFKQSKTNLHNPDSYANGKKIIYIYIYIYI
jgi:hypothetical protein